MTANSECLVNYPDSEVCKINYEDINLRNVLLNLTADVYIPLN